MATSLDSKINYKKIIEDYPWVTERQRKCVLSPDSDGFLCGLLMTNLLDWEIAGFYDGKVLILKDGTNYDECVFLDIEINRPNVASIGNHLVEYNNKISVPNRNFNLAIQPNLLRGFDGKKDFQRKYPFGTIHLLLGILQEAGVVSTLPDEAISPLLFADGVGNNLFGYPENCLDWIDYMRINNEGHILHKFLCENEINFYKIMQYLSHFFVMRDSFNAKGYFDGTNFILGGNNKRTGHKIKISNGQGLDINLVKNTGLVSLHTDEVVRVQGFIKEIGIMMGWSYTPNKWNWDNLRLTKFRKGMLSGESSIPTDRLNNRTYTTLFTQNPFSLAMTASNRIEYTLEETL